MIPISNMRFPCIDDESVENFKKNQCNWSVFIEIQTGDDDEIHGQLNLELTRSLKQVVAIRSLKKGELKKNYFFREVIHSIKQLNGTHPSMLAHEWMHLKYPQTWIVCLTYKNNLDSATKNLKFLGKVLEIIGINEQGQYRHFSNQFNCMTDIPAYFLLQTDPHTLDPFEKNGPKYHYIENLQLAQLLYSSNSNKFSFIVLALQEIFPAVLAELILAFIVEIDIMVPDNWHNQLINDLLEEINPKKSQKISSKINSLNIFTKKKIV